MGSFTKNFRKRQMRKQLHTARSLNQYFLTTIQRLNTQVAHLKNELADAQADQRARDYDPA